MWWFCVGFCVFFCKQKTAYELRISDWSSERVLFRSMIGDPNALFGLGDGGAHVGFITDASFPSFLLSHWRRDADDRLDVAELIRRLTRANAEAVGLFDRGLIAEGMKADLNLIDLEEIGRASCRESVCQYV